MRIFVVVFAVILVVLLITISLRIVLEYDLLENLGSLKLKLFGILTIYSANVVVVGDQLNLNKNKGKVVVIKLDLKDEKIIFLEDIIKNIFIKITIIKLHVFALICNGNPCTASYIGSLLNIFISVIYSRLLIESRDVDFKRYIATGYRQNKFNIKIDTMFLFSLYDVAWAVIKAIKFKIRRNYEKDFKLQQSQ